ncbi:MAG: hypothetical protein A3B08_00020 [Candidatus Taylorbacteria bacterium RIFCSPLOWO2_01_FULL_43_44]|nr:MAG: hypothetical protein A3B08_00020 [Candidatus Taylorbacteria bacterium RIFCSPLOWO2_01_FULL_43_44]
MVFSQVEDAVLKRQAELQAELDKTNADIEYWAQVLSSKQRESTSLARDLAILTAKIEEAKAKIRAKNIIIQQLSKDIVGKADEIEDLSAKLEREKESLAKIIRQSDEIESKSLAEFVFSEKKLSEFVLDLDSYNTVKVALNDSFVMIKDLRAEVETEKNTLSKKKNAETDARIVIEAEQRIIQKNEAEKKKLLAINQNQEKSYQLILSERQKKAAQIRSALFSLRDTAAIPFGTALGFAVEVEKMTGVRPAFLLAILTQETNLGENVGQCFVTNFTTGDGIGKKTGNIVRGIMKPSRDIKPFLDLAIRLGFDPKTRAVSCPQSTGWGGAMGPSQFIPSTWVGIESRLAKAAGVTTPDPWIPHDAFFASGLYLSDLGAGAGGYTAEWNAAAKYYAGGSTGWQTRGKSYANSVLKIAQNIQENMIDPLQSY